MSNDPLTGRCLCGSIAFELGGDVNPAVVCHCKQCRQWGGHAWASVGGGVKNLAFSKGEDKLKWYESSDFARRGFCSECGSSLFWQAHKLDDHKDHIAIAAGCIDELGDNHISKHIFCAHKGDYYEIGEDGVPQLDTH